MVSCTSRRPETPPISRSLALRARTNMTMPPGRPKCTRLVGVILKVTQPSEPVTASGGVVAYPNGIATTNTSAPMTEWFRLSETWNRAVKVCRERSGSGSNCRLSISSRFGKETSLIEIVAPLGASALPTTAVGTEVDEAEPRAFRAVTRTRRDVPSSAALRRYVFAVAPPISEQLAPVRSHRRQWYENVNGWAPTQAPLSAVSVWPTCGVPEIVGGLAFRGGPAALAD